MANKLVKYIIGIFGGAGSTMLGKYTLLFIISMCPILELRGGLIAARLLEMQLVPSLITCLVGNIIIIPVVLLLIEKIFNLLGKVSFLSKIIETWKKKALSKKDIVEKYGFWGLLLFVAIPLPGSGAWTGCLIAVLMGLDRKKSFIAVLAGVLIASLLMSLVLFGIF